jgi:hypothetical protein
VQLDRGEDGIVKAVDDERCVGELAVRRNRAGWGALRGIPAEIDPTVVQKRWADSAQSHQGRCAEFRTFGGSLRVRECIVGEVALQIEGVKYGALGTTRVVLAILVLGPAARLQEGWSASEVAGKIEQQADRGPTTPGSGNPD